MPIGDALPTRMPFSSGGNTYYVDSAIGDNSRTETQAQNPSTPWLTINKAINTVTVAGSTIICKGTFSSAPNYGSFAILIENKSRDETNPITIKAHADGCTITNSDPATGPTYGAWVWGTSTKGWRLEGIKFNVRGDGGAGILIEDGASWIELYRCRFIETGGGMASSRGRTPGSGPTTNLRWEACEFGCSDANPITFNGTADKTAGIDITDPYYASKGTHMMYLGDSPDGAASSESGTENEVVANCIFYGSTPGRHIQLGPQFRDGFVVNNTFYYNKCNGGNVCTFGNPNCEWFAGGGVEIWTPSGTYRTNNVVVANNIFQQMGGHAVYGSGGGGTVNRYVFNNIGYECDNGYGHQDDENETFEETYGGSSTLYVETKPDGGSAPNSVSNPLLADPTNRNFRPGPGSPALSASLLSWTPDKDFNGLTRSTTAPTIGALEVTEHFLAITQALDPLIATALRVEPFLAASMNFGPSFSTDLVLSGEEHPNTFHLTAHIEATLTLRVLGEDTLNLTPADEDG